MKKLLSILLLFACHIAQSQTVPQGINYQAVALDQSGQPIPGIDIVGRPIDDAEIGVRISIIENLPTGNILYQEEHEVLTDLYGMFNLVIGQGLQVSVDPFSSINWQGDKFLQVELSIENDGEFVLSAVQQLMSVPYAFLAENAMIAQTALDVDDADADPSNELQSLSVSGDSLTLSNGNTVQLPAIDDADSDPNNEIQVLSISNDTLYLSSGGFAVLPLDQVNDADADPLNEIQTLTKSGSTINLTNGGSVIVFDGNYNNLSNTPNIPNKTSDLTNDSGFITAEVDGSNTNELQLLSMSNDTLYLTDGGFVVLPAGFDGDYNSLTNTPAIPTKTSDLINDSGFITTEQDSSSTNELQTLSISNDTVFLSDGGQIKLPYSANSSTNSMLINNVYIDTVRAPSRRGGGPIQYFYSDTITSPSPGKFWNITSIYGNTYYSDGSVTTIGGNSLSLQLEVNGLIKSLPFKVSTQDEIVLRYNISSSGSLSIGGIQYDSTAIGLSYEEHSNGIDDDLTNSSTNPLLINNSYVDTVRAASKRYSSAIGYSYSDIITSPSPGKFWNITSIYGNTYYSDGSITTIGGNSLGLELAVNGLIKSLPFKVSPQDEIAIRYSVSTCCASFGPTKYDSTAIGLSYEEYANGIISDNDNDSTNELQNLSISNDTIFLTDGGYVKLPSSASSSVGGSNNNQINTVFSFPTANIDTGAFYYNLGSDEMAVFTYVASSTPTVRQGIYASPVSEGFHNSHTTYSFASFKASTDFFLTQWQFTAGGSNGNFSYIIIKDSDWNISNGDLGTIYSAHASGTTITPMKRIEKDQIYHIGIRKVSSSNSSVPLSIITNGYSNFNEISEFQRGGVTGKFWKSNFTFKTYGFDWRQL